MNQMDGNSPYCHSTWEDFDDLSEADKKLVQKQIEHQLKRICRTNSKETRYLYQVS